MIGTIRKHSKWLWLIIATVTIVSFVAFFNPAGRMNNPNGGGAGGDFGSVYGKKITQDEYISARNEFMLAMFFRNNYEWPDKLSDDEMARNVYERLLLIQKADDMGISVGDNEAATMANMLLRSPELVRALKINGDSVPSDVFEKLVLQPQGLTVLDFENFIRHDLAIQQLEQSLGMAGALVTPQEAASIYQGEHGELTAQIVFFSASNYLSQVQVTPEAVAQYYTNAMADYRLPDRVQVNYVVFNVTNYLTQAKEELAKTNLDQIMDNLYLRYGTNFFPDATTPDEIKAKFRDLLIRQQALADASKPANAFATTVFDLNPDKPQPADLATVAKQQGLAVKTTAPFDEQTGPREFDASAKFIQAAFDLNSDQPFAGPISCSDGVYVIALDKALPSEIPPLADIRAQVARDFQMHQAAALARNDGAAFAQNLTNSLARGGNFAVASVAAGYVPEMLSSFSLSTPELPELGGRAELSEIKQVAFTIGVGHASGFVPTQDGGFVLYVNSRQPADEAKMETDLPQFLVALRDRGESEAFNEWFASEIHNQFGNMKVFQEAVNGSGN
ncbi:MAG TPA: peptidylprolyl isomerase [Verrucomicrobiae bacterium]|nr:peptidylprolyl isomerase [Verrucomicrobiae bacterium]